MSVIRPEDLMLYSEIIAVCSQINRKLITLLRAHKVKFVNVIHGGTYCKNRALMVLMSVIKSSLLMQYREIIAVSFEIDAKEISELWLGYTICECSN